MSRSSYLHVTEQRRLRDWAQAVRRMFNDEMPYQVGSSLQRADWRDIDVRLMLAPEKFAALAGIVNLPDIQLAVSLWGQATTGLPIDFQVQDRDQANAEFDGQRDAIGIDTYIVDGKASRVVRE